MFSRKDYVYAVYQEKSFSAAAKKLFITQPALSNTIRRVESKIGAPIFDRTVTPIQLTEVGVKYIETVKEIMRVEESFSQYLDDLDDMKTGSLRLGGNDMITSYIIPSILTTFNSGNAAADISIQEVDSQLGLEYLLEGSLDLLFSTHRFENETLDCYILTEEHLYLALPKTLPITRKLQAYQQNYANIISGKSLSDMFPETPLSLFSDITFILSSSYATDYMNYQNWNPDFSGPNNIIIMNQELAAYNTAISGIGGALVSDTLIRNTTENKNVAYYKLNKHYNSREVYIYSKKNRYMTKCVRAFLDCCLNHHTFV